MKCESTSLIGPVCQAQSISVFGFVEQNVSACVDLPQIAPLFPRFGGLDREPGRELVGIGIELA
jgi:hypothetical protein